MTTTATAPLRAYHGNPAIKATYTARVRAHALADEIVQGQYWERGRGCAVGCTIHGSDHFAYERELGIPVQIAHLEDAIFEALDLREAKAWPGEFLDAIEPGADLSRIWPEFAAWLMDDPTHGVAHTTDDTEVKGLCLEVARRYRAGETSGPAAEELARKLWDAWDARAAWAARAAARAAMAAWDAMAAMAAWDAMAAMAARDAMAAMAARDARDARDARAAFVAASRVKLLELLRAAPAAT